MYSDVINIKIKLIDDDLDQEEKKDAIIEALTLLINQLKHSNGEMQQGKMTDDFCSIEYLHQLLNT